MVDQQLSPAKDTEVSLGKELLALSVTFSLKKDLKGHHVLFKVKLTWAKKKSRWVTEKKLLCSLSLKERARFDIMEFKTKSDSY